MHYPYVIVGGGLAAASAVEGIRSRDPDSPILMLSRENYPPYRRPPLTKDLWFGKATKDQLQIHDENYYKEQKVELALRREIVELDPERRQLWDERGVAYAYDKLLLATGGRPRVLPVEGGAHENVRYFRTMEDYLLLEARLERLQHVLVVGGGFISMELAAALRHAGKEVTFIYPHSHPLQRVLPRDLGLFMADDYRERGIETVSDDAIAAFEERGELIDARTRQGNVITTQLALIGVGIDPHDELADAAGLEAGNGIEVDEYARTSNPAVFAAGDVAEFPYLALGKRMRIEHWDHAEHHGRLAGVNMAGGEQVYEHLPLFFSDFFERGWEAVGDVDATLDVEVVWKDRYREGVLFYLREDVVRGVLLWNVWDKVDWARGLIRERRMFDDVLRAEVGGG